MELVNTALILKDLPLPPEGKTGWPWTEQIEILPDKMPDGSDWPRISIVTPNYNYGHFIEETIRSVLLQGYPNLEYIVIDGGSTDNSVEIIKKYEKWITYWVSEKDNGQTNAINKGYKHCTGKLFVWLNADDAYINSTCLRNVSELYQRGYQLIVGECLNVDENDKPIKVTQKFNGCAPPQNFDEYLRFWSFIPLPQPSVFISKELTDNAFPLDETLYGTMDYQLFLRVLSQNPTSIWVRQIWVKFKYHGKNKTMSSGKADWYWEFLKISLSEAQKKYNFFKALKFTISAKDYLIIQSLFDTKLKLKFHSFLTLLLSRPSLACWLIFWKIFAKSCFGNSRYLVFKQFVNNKAIFLKNVLPKI